MTLSLESFASRSELKRRCGEKEEEVKVSVDPLFCMEAMALVETHLCYVLDV